LEANILPMGGILSIPLKSRNFARTTNKRQKEKIEITKTHNQKIQSSSRVRENSPSNPQKKTGLSKILTRIHPCTLTPWGGGEHSSPKKHKSAEEEGLSENQNSSQTGFFCLSQQQKAAPPKIQHCSDPCKILAKGKFDLKNRTQLLPTQKSSFPHSTIHTQKKIED
jgi:hypothetical protein